MRLYGLTGYPLEHSRSPRLFARIAERSNLKNSGYQLFPVKEPAQVRKLVERTPGLAGLNVTIPLKSSLMPFLDDCDEVSSNAGAVNTVVIERSNKQIRLIGYNTDVFGFQAAYLPLFEQHHKQALILGTGGASKAVQYVFRKENISFSTVTRKKVKAQENLYEYGELNREIILAHQVVVNTTPAGMYPNIRECPSIPYQHIVEKHLCIDLIYNPEETLFLKKAGSMGASVINGWSMLEQQAGKACEIWKRYD